MKFDDNVMDTDTWSLLIDTGTTSKTSSQLVVTARHQRRLFYGKNVRFTKFTGTHRDTLPQQMGASKL